MASFSPRPALDIARGRAELGLGVRVAPALGHKSGLLGGPRSPVPAAEGRPPRGVACGVAVIVS